MSISTLLSSSFLVLLVLTLSSTFTVAHPNEVVTAKDGNNGGNTNDDKSDIGGSGKIIELYMHDILGGSGPSARPITGLLGNVFSGQVPFARPMGFLNPNNGNGVRTVANGKNSVPLDMGLSGTASVQTPNGPISTGQIQTPLGPDGLGVGFGTITVIDDAITSGPDLGSQHLGKAQGVYISSSSEGTAQMMAFTIMMEDGEYGDNFNLVGVYKTDTSVSHLSVAGGTGKFKSAIGYAEVRQLHPKVQGTDGTEALIRITIHLTY